MANTKIEFKVYGDIAKAIREGDEFIAKVGSVEGRRVVTMTLKEGFY